MRVRADLLSGRSHCGQITTGLAMLRDALGDGALELEFCNRLGEFDAPPYAAPIVVLHVDGKKLVYDLDDGYWDTAAMRGLLEEADAYFKRSFSTSENERLFGGELAAKMQPLGLYFRVGHPREPYTRGLVAPKGKALERRMRASVRRRRGDHLQPSDIACAPDRRAEGPEVVYCTRLWDPDELDERWHESWREDCLRMNDERVEVLRALRGRLGERFFGGLADSPLARKAAPDLILPAAATVRTRYIQTMRGALVGIATTGLDGSIGGKLGEYVAASKGIVSEPLRYELPGRFEAGENYLAFQTPDECVEAVERLLADEALLQAMRERNHAYYLGYSRPDRLVGRTLGIF